MKKNIAIFFPLLASGGVFHYALSIADSLINYCDKFDYSIFYYSDNPKEFLETRNNVQFIRLDGSPRSLIKKLKLLFNIFYSQNIFLVNKTDQKILKDIKIDLLIIPFSLLFGIENKIPYLVSIPDIAHRYHRDFPEYPFLQRLKRDIVYKHSSNRSILSIVDSQKGLDDLHKFYKIPKEKIRIIPYAPPGYIYKYKDMKPERVNRLLEKYNLPDDFLFYPAHFWYHKNHLRLIKALKLIEEKKGAKLPLVLVGNSGADKNNYQKVMSLAKGLDVKHLGYVSNKEIVALYKKSMGLVFSTLIRPTNIPPLEAIVLEKPVLCSGFPENQQQIGKAGIFFDPFSEKDMAEKIYQFWTNEKLRRELTQQAKEKAKEITLENYAEKWQKAIQEALSKNYEK